MPETIGTMLADQYRWGEHSVSAARPDIEYAVRYLCFFTSLLRHMTPEGLQQVFDCEAFCSSVAARDALADRVSWVACGLDDALDRARAR